MFLKLIIAIQMVFMLVISNNCFSQSNTPGEEVITSTSLQIAKIYPPYPEVWDYIAEPNDNPPIQFFLNPSGDISVVTKTVFEGTAEERITFSVTRSLFAAVEYPQTTLMQRKEIGIKELRRSNVLNPFEVSPGIIITNKRKNNGSANCGDLISDYVEVNDKNNGTVREFHIFYLPKEQKLINQENCEGGGVYPLKVQSLNLIYTPLEDDTFLASSRNADVVIRFRPDFSTGSPLLNKKIFIVPVDINPYIDLNIDSKGRTRSTDQDVYYQYLMRLAGERNQM